MGKTVTTEFGFARPGRTRNPHNTNHTPGGSSSGSVAAVADFMTPLTYGTQSGGSVIRPASFCGVVGYKASLGAFSLAGMKYVSQHLDTLGIFSRSVKDIILARSALLRSSADLQEPPAPPRLCLYRSSYWAEMQPDMQDALLKTARNLTNQGAVVEEIELPEFFAEPLWEAHMAVTAFETAQSFCHEYTHHRDALDPRLVDVIETGRSMPYSVYRAALELTGEGQAYMAENVFRKFHAILTPAAISEAPEGMETGTSILNCRWTQLGYCAISLPGHISKAGLPLGIQVVAPRYGDDRLLRVALWMEDRIA